MSESRRSIPSGMVKPALWMGLRLVASIVALVWVYYTIPVKGSDGDSDLPWLVLELVIFGVIVGAQVPLISRARYPLLRGLESLALTILLFLLIFARVYLSYSAGDPEVFSQPLDKDTALYFTTTVFATVGFGDIVAASNPMKLLVTVQMLLNLVVFGLVIRILTSATQRGMARKHGNNS
ncbi:MAG TPA: potassium channel family protein [Nakamurella sp.]